MYVSADVDGLPFGVRIRSKFDAVGIPERSASHCVDPCTMSSWTITVGLPLLCNEAQRPVVVRRGNIFKRRHREPIQKPRLIAPRLRKRRS